MMTVNPQCAVFSARHKAGGSNGESILVSQLQHGLTLEFEHSDPLRRLRLTLSELLAIMNKVQSDIHTRFSKLKDINIIKEVRLTGKKCTFL